MTTSPLPRLIDPLPSSTRALTMTATIITVFMGSLTGCQKSGAADSAINAFTDGRGTVTEGGIRFSSGEYSKFKVISDDVNFTAEVEIKSGAKCYRAVGRVPVKDIGGSDPGQFYDGGDIRTQINPKNAPPTVTATPTASQFNFATLFVHILLNRNASTTTPCSKAPAATVSDGEVSALLARNLFSEFNLTQAQLSMAQPRALLYGSNEIMGYFHNQDLGVIFDANTSEIVGISVPKHLLGTDHVFTVNRRKLLTNNMADNANFPVVFGGEDADLSRRSSEMTRSMRNAVQSISDADPKTRALVVDGTWWQFFH